MSHCIATVLLFSANIADPNQTAPKEQSDQGLHYLQRILEIIYDKLECPKGVQNTITVVI